MTATALPGTGLILPYINDLMTTVLETTAAVIDATGEKYAISGPVWWSDRGSHDIHTIGWRAGAIVSTGGSGITISLQDVLATTGPPGRPDEVQDQTVGVLLSALTANAWNLNTLTADRTVAHNAQVSVVWEYDVTGRVSPDSLVIAGVGTVSTRQSFRASPTLKAPTWAGINHVAILVLVASDGTIGTIAGAVPITAINAHAAGSGSSPDELANQINLPVPVTVEGIECIISPATGADFSVILYDGTTALETVAIDLNQFVGALADIRWRYLPFTTPRALAANTLYRVALRSDTTALLTIYSVDVADTAYWVLWGGANFHYWDRVDAGAWSNENTLRCLLMRLRVSQSDNGAGGGGGIARIIGG